MYRLLCVYTLSADAAFGWCTASRQVEGALALADGEQKPLLHDSLGGVGRQLDVIGTCHDRGQVAIIGPKGCLMRQRGARGAAGPAWGGRQVQGRAALLPDHRQPAFQ